MKKKTLLVLPLAALLFSISCTDSNYDLSDIDTHSRFNIDGLTIPLNMDPVKLDLMLDIADNSDIKTDSDGNYYFKKNGTFTSTPVNVAKIILAKPKVDFNGKVSVSLKLDANTKSKMQQYASNMTIGDILANQSIMDLIGINANTEILNINFNSTTTTNEINLNASNIDANVKSIESLGIDATTLAINVKINGIQNTLKPFTINDLSLTMPKGFTTTTKPGTTYDPEKGTLKTDNGKFNLDQDYIADLSLTVTGIDYNMLEEEGMKIFDPTAHTFTYKKSCSASGNAILKISDLKSTAKYADIVALEQQDAVTYNCNIGFSNDLTISSFLGDITYSLDDIIVDPITISDVPEILKENGTNIDLRNPQIYFDINNHLNKYGISVKSTLEIKGNNTITAPLTVNSTDWTKLTMAPFNEDMYHAVGYDYEEVRNLGSIVGSNDGQTFPEILNIRIIKPEVPKTKLATAFELGTNHTGVEGTWEFYTRLLLTDNTKIMYTKEWDDWNDEDLDGLTVNHATVNVTLQKDVELDAKSVEFILLGKKGELRGETTLIGNSSQNITIELSGGPLSEIKGAKLNVHLNGMNKGINKDQEIKISNLKVTVNGHYDREL